MHPNGAAHERHDAPVRLHVGSFPSHLENDILRSGCRKYAGIDVSRHIVPNRNRCWRIDTQSPRYRRGSQFRTFRHFLNALPALFGELSLGVCIGSGIGRILSGDVCCSLCLLRGNGGSVASGYGIISRLPEFID